MIRFDIIVLVQNKYGYISTKLIDAIYGGCNEECEKPVCYSNTLKIEGISRKFPGIYFYTK